MSQAFRIPRRRSDALRHADRVMVIGDLSGRPRLAECLRVRFGKALIEAPSLATAGVDDTVDAVLLLNEDPARMGIADIAALDTLARGRQVVCDLALLAALYRAAVDEDLMTCEMGEAVGAATLRADAWFSTGYTCGDVLPWQGRRWLRVGPAWGYKAPQRKLRIILSALEHPTFVLALDRHVEDGRLAALDLNAMDAPVPPSPLQAGFRDLAAMLLFEALGSESIDLGVYLGPWRSYDSYMADVELWARLHRPQVNLQTLAPSAPSGAALRRVDIGDTQGKPVVLFTCCTHGHEWGPSYGMFAFLRHLLADYERGSAWGRAVLGSIGIVWIPVVNVDGFQATWERGVLVPYSQRWVDLNRNFGPMENWSREKKRPKGDRPFSEPEAQALKAVIDPLLPRLKVHMDLHEQTHPGMLVHTRDSAFHRGMAHTLKQVFDGRFVHENLSGYDRVPGLAPQPYHGTVPSMKGEVGVCSGYAMALAGCEGGTGETFGNDDFSLYHQLSRIEASATLAEAVVGSVLGRTACNHRCTSREISMVFPDRASTDVMHLLRISPTGQVIDRTPASAADGVRQSLGSGERLLALAPPFHHPPR